MESNLESASLGHCTVHSSAVKLEKMEPSPQEFQDMKALQKELEQVAKLLKRKRITLGYTQAYVRLTLGVLFGKVISQIICWVSAALRPYSSALRTCVSCCGPCWRSG